MMREWTLDRVEMRLYSICAYVLPKPLTNVKHAQTLFLPIWGVDPRYSSAIACQVNLNL